MGLETTVWLNFYIHSALLPYPMVCEEFLTTDYSNLFNFSSSPMEGSYKNDQIGSILFGTQSSAMEGLYKNALKNYILLLPWLNRMEVATYSQANRKSQKGLAAKA